MKLSIFPRIALYLFWLVCLSTDVYSQLYRPSTIVPPSPTATSIATYGNVGVSYYNGSPNISIPLYDISTSNHSLKIDMRYDASGTKARQDASWIGLGWTLNAGGAITRIVRQQDDFIGHGYYFSQKLPSNTSGNKYLYNPATAQSDKTFFDAVYSGQMDAEPDIFSYNFAGLSGKFVMGKQIDGSVLFSDERNNLEFVYTSGRWVCIDGNGVRYYFGTVERTQDYYRSSNVPYTSFSGLDGFYLNYNSSPNTAWFIDSIVAPTTEKISFEYSYGKSLSLVNESEIYCKLINIIINGCEAQTPAGLSNDYRTYDAARQVLRDVYLKKISFATGSVEFKTSSRTDIQYYENNDGLPTPSKLDSIIIKDINNNRLKAYKFSYTYFNGTGDDIRLKLDSVAESGSDGTVKPPYSFSYFNPNSLPPKYTKAIDHWGYYNGHATTTLLPSFVAPGSNLPFTGADRSPDTIQYYLMNGVLSSISYPTGGKTSFEYELHDYSNLHGEQAYKTIGKSAIVRTNPDINPSGDVTDATFYIPQPPPPNTQTAVTVQCSYQKVNPNVSDLPSLGYSNMWRLYGDGSIAIKGGCTTANYNQPNPSPVFTTYMLDSGTYKMHIQSTGGWSFYMSASWEEKEPYPLLYRKGGGLRVKTITDEDMYGNRSVRKFEYTAENGSSYGKLISSPIYNYYYVVGGSNNIVGSGIVIPCAYIGNYYALSSGSIFPSGLSSTSGTVGYSKVVELFGENGENGKSVYYFRNQEESKDSFPFIPSYGNPFNGKIDSVLVYNASGKVVKKTDYLYLLKESFSLKGVKLFTAPTVTGAENVYDMKYYDNISSWVVLDTEKETVYDSLGGVTTSKSYVYDNNIHREATQIIESRSDGSTYKTKVKRPGDYTVSGNLSFVEQLRNIHVISPVIEEEKFVVRGAATKLLGGTFTSYKKFNNSFYKPDIIYNIETAVPLDDLTESSFSSSGIPVMHPKYKPQVYFDSYNTIGNLLSFRETNNISQTYVWGYQQQYPVAKILGADYNTAIQNINLTVLNNPASDAALRTELGKIRTNLTSGLVSTYTYSPLRGLTSETVPNGLTTFYEYDAFGRLKLIKDKDGKILKQIDYQFLKPITQ